MPGLLFLINLTFLVFGGSIYSGGFLGITGYGYGWDKTRTGLLVLLRRADPLHLEARGAGQDPAQARARRSPQTPEEERAHAELKVAPSAASS